MVDDDGKLTAVLSLQEVAVAQPDDRLGQLAHGPPVYVQAMSSREEVVELLEAHKLASLPVIGGVDGPLCGIIRHDALVVAARHEASENVQDDGRGPAERNAPFRGRCLPCATGCHGCRSIWVRPFWPPAAVALFEDTIARFTALAVFLPVVAGQAGNTGAQALAVASRGLALREFRPRGWFPVARKELLAGIVNGLAVALVASLAAYLWSGTDRASPRSGRVHGVFHVYGQSHRGAHSHCAYGFGKGPRAVGVDLPDHRNRRHRVRQLSGPGDLAGDIIRDDAVA